MTTISAGAAAGLLVALMVVATTDGRAAEVIASSKLDSVVAQPSSTRTVYQLRSTRTVGKVEAESAYAARI